MKKIYLLLCLCLSLCVNAQDDVARLEVAVDVEKETVLESCEDGLLGTDELRLDCGGPNCPRCIPLLYNVECDEDEGFFTVTLSLPAFWWLEEFEQLNYVYTYSGDYNNECFILDDCFAIVEYPDGTNATVNIHLRDSDGNTQAYGQVVAKPVCVKVDIFDDPECEDPNFAVQTTILEGDELSYMLKLEIEGGEPPYAIRDNVTNFFYEVNVENNEYYLGALPNGFEIDATVYDNNGCSAAVVPMEPGTGLASVNNQTGNKCKGLVKEMQVTANTLLLDLQETTEVSLNVYTMNGALVGSLLNNERLPIGQNQLSLDTRSFGQGLYIYQLQTCEGKVSQKILKQ